jgi:hypothetical protein
VESDVKAIVRHGGQQKPTLSGKDVSIRLRQIAEKIESNVQLSSENRRSIAELAEEASAWRRIKEDGYRGFANATIIKAFDHIHERCRAIGMVINKEGSLRGCAATFRKSRNQVGSLRYWTEI